MKRPGHPRSLHLLAGMLAACCALTAGAQMNKCVDKAGKVTYQQRPCDGAVVAPAPAVSRAAAGAAPAATGMGSDRVLLEIAFQLGVHSWCESYSAVEGEDQKYLRAVTEWRAKHSALIGEMEKVPAYLAAYGDGQSSFSKRYGVMDRMATAPCVLNWRRLLSANP